MVNCLDVIKCRTGAEKTSLIGYCMGGTMAAMFTALYPERVKNLITMAAPFDFSGREGLLFHWTAGTKFDPNLLVDTYGNCPTWFLESSFLLLKPLQNTVGKLMSLYENSTNEKFVENYLAMETWLNDNIPMAGETYREFVSDLFQKNQLMKGKKRINGRVVRLSDITCPVLNLVADKDHLVPPESSIPFNDAIGSEDKEVISFPAGHIGLSVGGRAVKELWPKVCGWLAERSK
jgi:polyhydroxyalkanoate synthase